MTRITQVSVLLVAAMSMSAAVACTTNAWNGGVTGNPLPLDGNPDVALPRVSGKCAMTLTAAGTVKDDSPVAEAQAFVRFYVLGDISSDVVIFEAYSNDSAAGGTELITVTYDGTNFVFNAGAGDSSDVPGRARVFGAAVWNMIQLSWVGGGTMEFTVNAGTSEEQTGSISAAAGTMESVILGSSADPGGTLVFDDYEAHRETPVDGLLIGDANNDGVVNAFDISSTVLETDFFNPNIQEGTPDCNMDGIVNAFDISALVLATDFFNPVNCNSN